MFTTPLSVLRADHPSHTRRVEMASVERHGDRTVLVLDDGTTIDFDAGELSAAACPVASDQPFWAGLRKEAA